MQNALLLKSQWKLKNMLLGLLPNTLPKMLEEMFKYMMTMAGIIYVAQWKLDVCPYLEDWENKLPEYAVMAKLTTYLRNSSIMKF